MVISATTDQSQEGPTNQYIALKNPSFLIRRITFWETGRSGVMADVGITFQGKAKLTSAEFVAVFKTFDADGRRTLWRFYAAARRFGSSTFALFNFSGNGYIEAGELDDFLQALWKELKAKVATEYCAPLSVTAPHENTHLHSKEAGPWEQTIFI